MKNNTIKPPKYFLEYQDKWVQTKNDLYERFSGLQSAVKKKRSFDAFMDELGEEGRDHIHRSMRLANAYKELAWALWGVENPNLVSDPKKTHSYDPDKRVIYEQSTLDRLKEGLNDLLDQLWEGLS